MKLRKELIKNGLTRRETILRRKTLRNYIIFAVFWLLVAFIAGYELGKYNGVNDFIDVLQSENNLDKGELL